MALSLSLPLPCARGAGLHLLAHYGFEGNAQDTTGYNAPFAILGNARMSNDVLHLEADNSALTPVLGEFSYRSFTVALDINITAFSPFPENILSGGPSYRWFALEQDEGVLAVRLSSKQANFYLPFANTRLQTNQWYQLVSSVDLDSGIVRLFLNGMLVGQLEVGQNAEFNVVGTSAESQDRVFSFRNYGTGSMFVGYADNLQIYNRAAHPAEVADRIAPRLRIASSGNIAFLSASQGLTGYRLQFSETPAMESSWVALPQTPASVGDFFIWPKLMQGPQEFFRLHKK
jgi:hypothetical protein